MPVVPAMFVVFFLAIVLGLPIFCVLAAASLAGLVIWGGIPLEVIPQRLFTGIDSFSLIAIPFFMIGGLVMERGGLAKKLLDFSSIFVGRIRGGLAVVDVIACMFFGGISGAASAEAAAVGSVIIPDMIKKGYNDDFTVALTVAAASIGVVIPPSIPMVIYGVLTDQSVGDLFIGGAIPGILIGLSLIAVSLVIAWKRNYPREDFRGLRHVALGILRGFPVLFTIIIIFGGIFLGVFTPTEAAAAAAVYALILALFVYHTVTFKDLIRIFEKSGTMAAVVALLIASSNIFSWILATQQVPAILRDTMLAITTNKYLILAMILVIYLIAGCIMDLTPAMIILVPIFLPLINQLGISLLHFGIITVVALAIGLYTPPVGTALAVGLAIGKVPVGRVTKALVPFFLAMVAILALVTYVPQVSLYLLSLR
ncbi:MAG TPA: TRAP transporter large permease [Firmicutes bacterium]|nr:TRAP transporter large permease [Bacillota bacterium]